MPIEVKELHIRVAVNTPQNQQSAGNRAANGNGSSEATGGEAKEMLIAECVEQIMQILQEKMER